MSTPFLMPKWGMAVTEATIVKWLKAEGDYIQQGDRLVEIETAKALEEVESPLTGTLSKILLAEGETAEVHTEIALIDEHA